MTKKTSNGQTLSKKGHTYFGLRIDVDTIKGLREGVPRALDLLDDTGIPATFFVTTGPDRTGRNLFHQHQRKRSSLKKNPLRRYGLKQILYGLLLPAPRMETERDIIKDIVRNGHEVGLHGFDHYRWANYFHLFTDQEIKGLLTKGIQIFTQILGQPPTGFAPPAFKWSISSLIVQNEMNFTYSSDMHGDKVFYPQINSKKLNMLQIPVSHPSIEELEVAGISDSKILGIFRKSIQTQDFVTIYVHAGFECIFKKKLLRSILSAVQRFEHITSFTFVELAKELARSAMIRKLV